ncbi:PREDICTED: PITH domain-containing protein At3g04780 [Ipomoea nil]|uniref:PITH domain-containing protein At3g04780 n=1 Tax=Ipomoea nil TaxID=35883 RepID=UPI000900FE08|nr:PREDICTED: PITH domain-containing protein At3g04780 [Ipomoea nil]
MPFFLTQLFSSIAISLSLTLLFSFSLSAACVNRPSTMSAESASAIPKGQVDLLDFIDWSGVECLNQNSSHSISNALKQGYREDEGLNLESDADEQLLIYIPFNQVIKLHSIVVKGPEEEGPKTVKLFANREHMGFSNVNDFPPSDMAELSVDNLKGKPVTLKYVKFQNVRSVTIFIEDNQSGTDITKVQKILLYGTTVETTDMKGLKKIEDH